MSPNIYISYTLHVQTTPLIPNTQEPKIPKRLPHEMLSLGSVAPALYASSTTSLLETAGGHFWLASKTSLRCSLQKILNNICNNPFLQEVELTPFPTSLEYGLASSSTVWNGGSGGLSYRREVQSLRQVIQVSISGKLCC